MATIIGNKYTGDKGGKDGDDCDVMTLTHPKSDLQKEQIDLGWALFLDATL